VQCVLGLLVSVAVVGLGGIALASFTGSSASGASLSLARLDDWLPSAVTTSRITADTCLVSWTPHGSAPAGATYDITDGTSTVLSDIAGTTTVITVGAGQVTPAVRLRSGTWLSTAATAASTPCTGWPDAPTLTLTPTDGRIDATWTAPNGNGAAITSYTAGISPAGTGTGSCTVPAAAARTCLFTGLTNGTRYTVTVTATSSEGTGPAATATTSPYPDSVMTGPATRLWLDGADTSTLYASPGCTGPTASSTVGCWKDKSGNADHAVQITGADRPTLSTLNGLSAPAFDGTSSVMDLDVTKLPTGSSPSTVYLVATQEDPAPTTSNHRSALSWGAGATGQSRAVTKFWHSTEAHLDTWGGAGTPTRSWTGGGAANLFDAQLTGTDKSVDLDGVASYTEPGSYSTGTTGAWVGTHIYGNWAFWQGRIAEIVVLDQTVTADQNRQVQEYLARKWGVRIPAQAPAALTGAPTAAAGTSATMSWTAPSWNGGSVTTGYTVTATPTAGGSPVTCTSLAPSTTCTLTGLAGGGAEYTVTVAADNTVGTGPASPATTIYAGLPVTSNLVLWLDGADGASLFSSPSCSGGTASTAVGCWKDKSATGNDAVQVNGTRQPGLGTVDGRSVPSFDGSTSTLSLSPGLLPVGTTTGTQFVVATLTDPAPASSGLRSVMNYGTLLGGQARQIQKLASGGSRAVSTGTAVGQGTWTSGPGLVAAEFTASSETIWSDGRTGSSATGLTNATGTTYANVGSSGTPAQFWYGQVPEVLVYSGSLTTAERRAVEVYLARKWGVTITPAAPTAATAVPGDGTAAVSWTAPASNGGSAVTSYTVTPVGGPGSCTWTAGTTAGCTGLTDGTPYTFTVAAVNAVGTGPTTSTASVTPAGPPGAPTGVAASVADTISSVSWTAPASDGGSAITSYTATAVPADHTLAARTCSAATSPCTLTGLTDGVGYAVSVTATNALGTGPASVAVTPVPIPAVMTTPGLTLWLDGADSSTLLASSGCTGAVATSTVGCWKDKSASGNHVSQPTPGTRPGLTTVNGRSVPLFDGTDDYLSGDPSLLPTGTASGTVVVAGAVDPAVSMNGISVLSYGGTTNASQRRVTSWVQAGVDVLSTPWAFGSPWPASAAQGVVVGEFASGTSVSVWTSGDGGATGSGAFSTGSHHFWVGSGGTSTPSGGWMGNTTEVLVFSGTLTAAERRAVEEYLARKWGGLITPAAPQSPAATAGSAAATVSWSAPAWDGGAAVTSYTVTPVGGPGSCSWSAGTTASCSGLTNGTAYTFTVEASNGVGAGPTAVTGSVTPRTVPGAPTAVAATAADTTSSVSWTAPASDGGAAVTSYTATAVPADGTLPTRTCTAPGSPCTVGGLTDGVTYTVTVTATNAVGTGAASAAATALPYPATVMAGGAFKVWLAADDLDGDGVVEGASESGLVSSAVQTWADKSGNGHSLTAASAGERPPYGSQTLNSLRVPTFNGSMSLQEAGANPYSVTADRTLVAVVRSRTVDTSGTGGTSSTGTYVNDRSSNTSGVFSIKACGPEWGVQTRNDTAGTGGAALCTSSGFTPSAGQAEILTVTRAGTTDAVWVSGQGGATGTQTGTLTQAGLTIGRTNAATQDLDVAEFMLFGTALSAADRAAVDEYLARKWGGVIAPSAPVSPSATASGDTATISWSAPAWDGGAAVGSYAVSTAGGRTCTSSGTSCQITGLVPGATYTFTVTATNPVGTGPASTTSVTMPAPVAPVDTFELSVWGSGAGGRTGVLILGTGSTSAVRMPGPESWATVSAGTDHTCGLTTGGALYCWGDNSNGELGVGDLAQRWEPVPVSAGVVWSSVTAGQDDTCAIKASDSSLWCWGYYGATNLTTPVQMTTTGVTTWSSVSVGIQFGCGLKTDGTLWCLGVGANGQLGNGSLSNQTSAVQVSVGTTFSGVTTGAQHACAIRATDSVLLCWGSNGSGQLGDGTTTQASSPVTVSGGLAWSDVSAGQGTTCGVTTGGSLYCWGAGGLGQLGNGGTSSSSVPVRESTAATIWSSVTSTFGGTSCALKADGTAFCWGANADGEIGDGSTTDRTSPTASGAISDWTSISGGDRSVCGVRSDHAVWCQGYDGNGELGQHHGVAVGSPTPVIPGAGPWLSGSTGDEGGCGVQSNGTLWCWGDATNGQTGVGGATGNVTTPTAGPADLWSEVSVGETHTCGVTTSGSLYCWGENSSGQLGQGDTTDQPAPVAVGASGVGTWSAVSAGYYSTCAIAATGANAGGLYCWGMNSSGQVGNGGTAVQTSPVHLGSATWSAVAAGRQHTCGVRTAGTLWCWGANGFGQLGQGGAAGTPANATSPQQVGSATTWSSVGAGYEFSCAGQGDGTLWCWGRNDVSQLGDRTGTTRTSPTRVNGYAGSVQELHGSATSAVAAG
jgi:alpha-tubulin suppressor-like RCC1 family protein